MKIDILWFFNRASWVFPNYRDGVRAMSEVLQDRGHDVLWHLGLDPKIRLDTDYILVWDSSNTAVLPLLQDFKCKKGLLLTTDLGLNLEALRAFDVIFAEASSVVDKIRPYGIKVIKAFGTDTRFFNPLYNLHSTPHEKIYDALYPATFSPWKRQDIFSAKYGDKGLCIGTIQPDGFDILNKVIENGTNIYIGYMPVEELREYYAKSKLISISGYEGSGRTVLEAMSMGIPVEAAEDNIKCQDYIRELADSGLPSRKFILDNYSEEIYSDKILKGYYD